MNLKQDKKPLYILAGATVIVGGVIGIFLLNNAALPFVGSFGGQRDDVFVTMGAVFGSYKNGEYTANGTYVSPGGREHVRLTLTLSENTITDITFSGETNNPTSREYQALFANNFKSQVVGRKIDDIHLRSVSGSSLTPIGFNDALNKIRQDAKE